jgi:hypothetical protein
MPRLRTLNGPETYSAHFGEPLLRKKFSLSQGSQIHISFRPRGEQSSRDRDLSVTPIARHFAASGVLHGIFVT